MTRATVHRLRKPREHGTIRATIWPWGYRSRLRPSSLTEILAELDERPDPGRAVCGYQIKVGTERNPLWLHPCGDRYEVTDTRPLEPPFATECEARLARTWFIETVPDVPTLCEPVYTQAPLGARPKTSHTS